MRPSKTFIIVLKFILTLFTITTLTNCNNVEKKPEIKQEHSWINFDWVGDSIGNKYFDKAFIYIPFTIEGIPHKFNSQFDLGAPNTMVYGNSIEPYLNKYPSLSKNLDTLNKKYRLQNVKRGFFRNINFKLDTVLFKKQELVYHDRYGRELTLDSIDTKTVKQIGTIGANLFQNKYLLIDFANERLATLDSLNKYYKEKTAFVDIRLDNGRIKVPVRINDSIRYFMFDTGASLFPLVVTKEDLKLISNSNVANDTLNISSWGEYYDVHGYSITSNISIGDLKINTQNFNVYDSKKEFKQFYEQEEIMGLMGNAFFVDKAVIIDYQNQKFGIVN